jgi:hypothetical protein
MKIIGIREDGRCRFYVDGVEVPHIVKHSPTGMEMGYFGSGPSDTALSILTMCIGTERAKRYYQNFKFDYVSKWHGDRIEDEIDIEQWIMDMVW